MSMFTHGFSSFMGSFVPVLPFLVIADRMTATIVTVLLCLIALLVLGVYLGRVSRENILRTSLEVVVIGVLIGVVSLLLGGSH